MNSELIPLDLNTLADNGLKRGYTTGSCATAAVKAALLLLQHQEETNSVQITLPDQKHFLTVPIKKVELLSTHAARAEVIKNGGDDPDNTHGATIFAVVEKNNESAIQFKAGVGVGTVTEPGIRVPIGEPAINPVPREMIRIAVSEVFEGDLCPGLKITIGCLNGAEIAKRTFNPRLGIKDGISILGTTGIVEPMSLSAYMASVEVYIRVALADNPDDIAFLPGNIGIRFCNQILKLPKKRIVNISNFLGFSLDSAKAILQSERRTLPTLWVLGHPGKIAKVLDGHWDTHSQRSTMAMPTIARVAKASGFAHSLVQNIAQANSVEAIVEMLAEHPGRVKLWSDVEKSAAQLMKEKLPSADKLEVRLFSMNGTALGAATDCQLNPRSPKPEEL